MQNIIIASDLIDFCKKLDVKTSLCTHWSNGSEGTKELAKNVVEISLLSYLFLRTILGKILKFTLKVTDFLLNLMVFYHSKSLFFIPVVC